MPPAERRWRRSGGHLPLGHLLRRRQDAWPDRAGSRGRGHAGRGGCGGIRRCRAAAGRSGAHRRIRRRKRRPRQWPGDGGRGAGAHALGRDRILAGWPGGLRAGAKQRPGGRGPRRRDAAGVVRRRADADSAGRTLGVSAQGAAPPRCPRSAHRLSHLSVQGRGGRSQRSAGLHLGAWPRRPGHRRLQRGKPVRGRPDGGGGERFRPQGHAAEPHRRRRIGASAAPPPVRAHRRRRRSPDGQRLPQAVGRTRRPACRGGQPSGNRRGVRSQLSAASRSAANADRQDRHHQRVPARARHVAPARPQRRPSLAAAAGGCRRPPSASHRLGLRADSPRGRHPLGPIRLRAGHRQRHRRRAWRKPRPRAEH